MAFTGGISYKKPVFRVEILAFWLYKTMFLFRGFRKPSITPIYQSFMGLRRVLKNRFHINSLSA
jgi:hypothetical protein